MTEYETQSIALLKAILEAQINLVEVVSLSQSATDKSRVKANSAKRDARKAVKAINKSGKK